MFLNSYVIKKSFAFISIIVLLTALIVPAYTRPTSAGNDGDLVPDSIDLDDDNDGIPDIEEGYDVSVDTTTPVIPSTAGTVECGDCSPNPGWNDLGGTPDVSSRTTAASSSTPGGGSAWLNSPLPPTPTGDDYFITLRDVGSLAAQESVGTTITNLIDGKIYELSMYTITARAGNYGDVYETNAQVTVDGAVTTYAPVQEDWGTTIITFTASGTTASVSFQPGNDSTASGSNYSLFQPVGIAVSVNAVAPSSANHRDTDSDGTPDYLDLDSDNDGISDLIESGQDASVNDTDNDGIHDNVAPAELTDGIPNAANGGSGVSPIDSYNTVSDNLPDYIDLDSDDDGIPDAIEAQQTTPYSDPSHIANASNNGVNDTGLFIPYNHDGMDQPDYLDLDSDNDNINDSFEITAPLVPSASNVDAGATASSLLNTDGDTTEPDFRDNEPPTITNNTLADVAASNVSSYVISGVCEADGDTVDVAATDSTTTVNATSTTCGAVTTGTYSVTVDLASLDDGSIDVTSTIDDGVNATVSDTDSATKDVVLPTITQNAATDISSSNAANYAVSGSCTADGDSVVVDVTDSTPTTVSTTTACSSNMYAVNLDVSSLTDGSVTVSSVANDGVNATVSDTDTVTMDTVLPTITNNTLADVAASNVSSYVISGVCEADGDTVDVAATDSTTTVNATSTTCGAVTTGTYSVTVDLASLDDGSIDVTSTIDDGVNATVSDTDSATKDVVLPTITQNAATDISSSNAANYAVSGSCTADGDSVVVDVTDSTPTTVSTTTACSSNMYAVNLDVSSLTDGSVTVSSVANDGVNATVSDTDTVTMDTVLPTITNNTLADVAASNVSSYVISGVCEADGDTVDVAATDSTTTVNATSTTCGAVTTGTYSVTVDLASLDDGSIDVTSTIDDGVNATVSDTDSATKDVVLPTITQNAATDISSSNAANYAVSGSCTADGDSVVVDVTDSTPTTVSTTTACSSNMYAVNLDVSSLTDGSVTVSSVANDGVNATVSDTDTVTMDTVLPTITNNTLADVAASNVSSYVISGVCEADGDTVDVAATDSTTTVNATSTTCGAVTTGTYSVTVDLASLDDGSIDVTSTIDDGVNATVSDTDSVVIPIDLDSDDTSSEEELKAPNNGDGNNDGIQDHLQSNVTSKINPVIDAYVTTEANGSCDNLTSVSLNLENDLGSLDNGFNYELGLHGFESDCIVQGGSVTITHFWDKEYNTEDWIYRKYIANNDTYINFNDQVSYGTADIGGDIVTTVSFVITDGGEFDGDGLMNGRIVDPAGPAILSDNQLSDTGSSAPLYSFLFSIVVSTICTGMYHVTKQQR